MRPPDDKEATDTAQKPGSRSPRAQLLPGLVESDGIK